MGLKLRLNLFYQVPHQTVYEAYAQYYRERRIHLVDNGDDFFRFDLHERDNDWTTVWHPLGRYWTEWQAVQVFTSRLLSCTNLLLFVYDGDDWGYQLCTGGQVIDRFVQSDEDGETWFPGEAARGNAGALAGLFPWLNREEVALYFHKLPPYGIPGDYMEIRKRLNIRVRPDDPFCRFDECAILNLLRQLKVRVEMQTVIDSVSASQRVTFLAPLWKSFWLEGRQRFQDDKEEWAKVEKAVSEALAREGRSE